MNILFYYNSHMQNIICIKLISNFRFLRNNELEDSISMINFIT